MEQPDFLIAEGFAPKMRNVLEPRSQMNGVNVGLNEQSPANDFMLLMSPWYPWMNGVNVRLNEQSPANDFMLLMSPWYPWMNGVNVGLNEQSPANDFMLLVNISLVSLDEWCECGIE
ncbi:hypothetical protein DMENIID0001_095600 [Sergentomyia squamirostris]